MGFSLHDIWGLKSKGVIEVKAKGDYPTGPHWQIHVLDKVTPYTGYENDPGGGVSSPQPYWRIFAFTDKTEWLGVLQAYYEDLTKPRERYASEPMTLMAFEVTATARATVNVQVTT